MHFGWTSKRGLNKENRVVSQLFFYALILHSTLRLDSVYGIKKPEPSAVAETQVFFVERSIELSNLIDSGLEQIEEHFNPLN